MPEQDFSTKTKEYYLDVPHECDRYFLKGSANYDWGMKNRLSRIFDPASGNTVMLAFDHGYFQGPTTGLERPDVTIRPLAPYADALMCTRGVLRSQIHPETADAVVLRASGGPSILKDLSHEYLAMDVEEALRLNAAAVAVQVFIGGEHESESVHNMTSMVDACYRYGIPVLGVTAVGTQMTRDARYIGLATRIIAELGATIVKTYYIEDFEKVTAACPVPIVMAGGKKLPELDALQMARDAIDRGASGVDMGRNVFQSDDPVAMIQAVRKVVHEKATAQEAHDYYRELKGA